MNAELQARISENMRRTRRHLVDVSRMLKASREWLDIEKARQRAKEFEAKFVTYPKQHAAMDALVAQGQAMGAYPTIKQSLIVQTSGISG